MSNTDWTPGPWAYAKDACAKCDETGTAEYIILGPEGAHHGQFSCEADARLIATAPELYEALSDLVEAHVDWLKPHVDFDPERDAFVINARAALAKAKGQTG